MIDAYEEALKAEKPVKAESIESFLLRMNDLPGLSFRAILSPFEESTDGAVRLTLIPSHTQATGYISTDNFNSRYLGPYQATASYSTSIMPFQQTSFSGVRSLGQDKLHSVSLTHLIPVWTNTDLELNGAVTNVYPGYTLEPLEIHSRSSELAAAINYHWIRLRQENLSTKLKFDARDTVSHLLGVKTTEDIVRAIRVSVDYDRTDSWQGYNLVDITVSKGIDTLGTQVQNPLELSRAGASPTFTKAEFSLTRLQAITPNWSVLSRAAGQISSGTLYSSEQFGYGGQVFGRAFDASELVGDHGIAGSLELRYDAFSAIEPVGAQPFVFYDAGLVGSHSSSQLAQQTASSTGGGVRLNSIYGQSASITAAFPLGHDAETPLYGADGDGPRFSIQFTQKF